MLQQSCSLLYPTTTRTTAIVMSNSPLSLSHKFCDHGTIHTLKIIKAMRQLTYDELGQKVKDWQHLEKSCLGRKCSTSQSQTISAMTNAYMSLLPLANPDTPQLDSPYYPMYVNAKKSLLKSVISKLPDDAMNVFQQYANETLYSLFSVRGAKKDMPSAGGPTSRALFEIYLSALDHVSSLLQGALRHGH